MKAYIYRLEFRKPHKWFFKSDVVYGEIRDGQAERMHVFGWSKKLRKFISDYYCSYQGWHWKNNEQRDLVKDGRGYMRITGTIEVDYDKDISGLLGRYEAPHRLILTEDDSVRFFNELLSTGKVEPYKG